MKDQSPLLEDTDSELVQLRRYATAYQSWRSLFEMLIHDAVLELSPNHDVIMNRIVFLGVAAREQYHAACLDVFTGIPIDRWEDVGKQG
jgi:hypothetical protein